LTKRPVLSSDLLIEYENGGQSIAEIVASHNGDWRWFRDHEYGVLKKMTAMNGVILDCGGGVVVDLDENGEEIFSKRKVKLLKKSGTVIWLKGDIARLAEKTRIGASRPSLHDQHSAEEIMTRRLPYYQKAADLVIDIEGKTRLEITDRIFKKFRKKL
jgi:shikimate kinase